MTAPRQGGSTARGLRYPGNDITVDKIPTAIQNLAEDIDRALGQAGAAAFTVQQISSYVTLSSSATGSTGSSKSTAVTFSLLKSVAGCVAGYGQDGFAAGLIIQISGNTVSIMAPMTSYLTVKSPATTPATTPNPSVPYAPQYVGDSRSVVVDFIAWGPPA